MFQSLRKYQFKATIKASEIGSGGSYVKFPLDVLKEFGTKGRVKIRCLFENIEYRGSLVKMGTDCHIIGLTKSIRQQLHKEIGDEINVELWQDLEERVAEIPEELLVKLENNPALLDVYSKLSYTRRKEIYNYISTAKKSETKNSRVAEIIQLLLKS